MRIYLDFESDESYTPTKIRFAAGMGEGGLVEFGGWDAPSEEAGGMESVRGWVDVDLKGVGGRERRKGDETLGAWGISESNSYGTGVNTDDDEEDDGPGDVLKCMVVQVRVCENHQNGKDTHVRGFQVFARDDGFGGTGAGGGHRMITAKKSKKKRGPSNGELGEYEAEQKIVGFEEADWLGDPEIR